MQKKREKLITGEHLSSLANVAMFKILLGLILLHRFTLQSTSVHIFHRFLHHNGGQNFV